MAETSNAWKLHTFKQRRSFPSSSWRTRNENSFKHLDNILESNMAAIPGTSVRIQPLNSSSFFEYALLRWLLIGRFQIYPEAHDGSARATDFGGSSLTGLGIPETPRTHIRETVISSHSIKQFILQACQRFPRLVFCARANFWCLFRTAGSPFLVTPHFVTLVLLAPCGESPFCYIFSAVQSPGKILF